MLVELETGEQLRSRFLYLCQLHGFGPFRLIKEVADPTETDSSSRAASTKVFVEEDDKSYGIVGENGEPALPLDFKYPKPSTPEYLARINKITGNRADLVIIDELEQAGAERAAAEAFVANGIFQHIKLDKVVEDDPPEKTLPVSGVETVYVSMGKIVCASEAERSKPHGDVGPELKSGSEVTPAPAPKLMHEMHLDDYKRAIAAMWEKSPPSSWA